MGVINIKVPDERHVAFAARSKALGQSMNALLNAFISDFTDQYLSYVEGQIVPYGHTPGAKDASAGIVMRPPQAPVGPKPLPVGLGKPDMTAEQYKKWVSAWRMSGYKVSSTEDLEDMIKWAETSVSDGLVCNAESVRALIKEYPPDAFHPLQKKTDKFLGIEE